MDGEIFFSLQVNFHLNLITKNHCINYRNILLILLLFELLYSQHMLTGTVLSINKYQSWIPIPNKLSTPLFLLQFYKCLHGALTEGNIAYTSYNFLYRSVVHVSRLYVPWHITQKKNHVNFFHFYDTDALNYDLDIVYNNHTHKT